MMQFNSYLIISEKVTKDRICGAWLRQCRVDKCRLRIRLYLLCRCFKTKDVILMDLKNSLTLLLLYWWLTLLLYFLLQYYSERSTKKIESLCKNVLRNHPDHQISHHLFFGNDRFWIPSKWYSEPVEVQNCTKKTKGFNVELCKSI